jgi:type I restriction enzyme S subunit
MGEWKEYKLGDLADITSSKRIFFSEYVQDGVPFYRSKEIIDLFNRRDIQTEHFITEKKYNEINDRFGVPECNDILLTSVGSLGIPYKVKPGDRFYFKDGNLTWFRSINQDLILPNFLYTWINSHIGKQKLDEIAIGSTQAALTISGLKSIDILLPDINTQQSIAEVLSSLDDKIDLLHRQNKTLEQLAETLFRQWFVEDNTSKDVIELSSFVNIFNGVSYKSSELIPSSTAMVSLKNFDRNGGFRIDGFKEFTGKYKEQQIVKEGDLIVAHTDITQEAEVIGNPALVISNPKYNTMVISMDIVKVVPKVDWISVEFLYFLMKTREFKGHCEGSSNGSTVLHLSKKAIPTFEFKTPKKEKVSEFSKQTKELTSKIFENYKQIRTLTQLRDTLLPKLMSGEVRVNTI